MARGGGVGGGDAQRAHGACAVRARLRGEKLPIWASPRSEHRVFFCRRLACNPPTYLQWPSPRFFESPLIKTQSLLLFLTNDWTNALACVGTGHGATR